jgi:predicted  nucleic acid-binding Zn-ribbon protein
VSGENLEREIEALEEEFATLQATEHEDDSAVTALSVEIERRSDRLAATRRALADHEQRMLEKRAELDEAMAEDARGVFEQVMQDRHEAAKSLADSAELLLDRLAALDRLREAARSAWATAESRGRAVGKPLDEAVASDVEGEPEVMRESWDRLCQEVRQRISEQFEDQLVEAAARSPMGHAIPDLPAHLQELARQRQRALFRQSRPSRS